MYGIKLLLSYEILYNINISCSVSFFYLYITMNIFFSKKLDLQLFTDPTHNEQFISNGFFHMPFLTKEEVKDIEFQLERLSIPNITFFHSHGHLDYNLKTLIDELINNFIQPKLYRLCTNKAYKVFTSVYINKNPVENTDMFLHADDSLCDERYHMPFSLWIPLVDVNYLNGTICLVPELI